MQFARHAIQEVADYSGISARYKYKRRTVSLLRRLLSAFQVIISENLLLCGTLLVDIFIVSGQFLFYLL